MGKSAWEELAAADLGPAANRSGTRWGRVLTALLVVGGATFAAAFYLPLHRAYDKLADQYRELGARSQALREQTQRTELDLKAATEERDRLKAERDRSDAAVQSVTDKLEQTRAALATKLEKFSKKGLVAVVTKPGVLLVGLDAAFVFVPQKMELTPAARGLVCEIVKGSEPKSLSVRSSVGGAVTPAPLEKAFANAWAFSAARAAAVAQAVETSCAVPKARIISIGDGMNDAWAAQLAGTKLGPERIELELGAP